MALSEHDRTKSVSYTDLNNLASESVGARIIFATDDWFAPAENLLKDTDPVYKEGVFTEFGKWMDGWETRRKRTVGNDWCIIQLGAPTVLEGFDVDTAFFTGNYAPKCSIQATYIDKTLTARSRQQRMGSCATEKEIKTISSLNSEAWPEIVGVTKLSPGYRSCCHNYIPVSTRQRITHIRLNMLPDGGIARFRAYGICSRDWSEISLTQEVDLAAMLNGGVCVGYSDKHYGHARNLIIPGRAKSMAEGWETARRLDRPEILTKDEKGILQVPGYEWAEFKLADIGVISKIEVDTHHFKGNFPDSCYIEACCDVDSDRKANGPWKTLLPVVKLKPHKQHFFTGNQLNHIGLITHIRFVIAPDGGVSRLRLWGYRTGDNLKHKI